MPACLSFQSNVLTDHQSCLTEGWDNNLTVCCPDKCANVSGCCCLVPFGSGHFQSDQTWSFFFISDCYINIYVMQNKEHRHIKSASTKIKTLTLTLANYIQGIIVASRCRSVTLSVVPTPRPPTPTLPGCWSSHCCVFVLIITCAVCNTMGRAESTGFVMQGSAAAKTQSWKRGRATAAAGGVEGTERAGRRVPQQEACYWSMSSDVAVVLSVHTHAVQPNFAQTLGTLF